MQCFGASGLEKYSSIEGSYAIYTPSLRKIPRMDYIDIDFEYELRQFSFMTDIILAHSSAHERM